MSSTDKSTFWLYFIIVSFFSILGLGVLLNQQLQSCASLVVAGWLIANFALLIVIYAASLNRDCQNWWFVNVAFISSLVLSVLWAWQDSVNNDIQIIIGVLILLLGLVLCGFANNPQVNTDNLLDNTEVSMYDEFFTKPKCITYVIAVYLIIWTWLCIYSITNI